MLQCWSDSLARLLREPQDADLAPTALREGRPHPSEKIFASQERVSGFPEKGADLRGSLGNFRGSLGELPGNPWIAVKFHSERTSGGPKNFRGTSGEVPEEKGLFPQISSDFPGALGSGKGRKRQKKGDSGRFRPISRKGGQTPLKPPFVTPPFAAAQRELDFGPFRARVGSVSGPSWDVGSGRGEVVERGFCKGEEYHYPKGPKIEKFLDLEIFKRD